MKSLKTLSIAVTLFAATILAVSASAVAGSPGQLAGGDNYVVKNVTKKGAYANNVSAVCKDEIQYSMQLSNTHFGALNNVTLKATLPTNGGTSTATATTDLGGTSGTSDTASVSLPSGATQKLKNGTTVLYNDNGGVIRTLPDTITSGVNVGTINGSTTVFVNFKVNVDCPTPPPVVSTAVCKALKVDITNAKEREVRAILSGEVNNATITGYRINFGDGTVVNETPATHKYAKDGSYTITGTIIAKLADGTTVERTADACAQTVKFEAEKPPVVTPPAPTPVTPVTPAKLPETGAAGILGAFVGVSGLSSLGYYLFGRRFNR